MAYTARDYCTIQEALRFIRSHGYEARVTRGAIVIISEDVDEQGRLIPYVTSTPFRGNSVSVSKIKTAMGY